ncbi:hypothetical protein [Burkholderia ubonensis]|uniref:hypothetical protein n=1 Tax=Burkholderia ubonensis TaxID=101571 RepID=UPI00075C62BB|nr:hypothetical protein [Burkholderia ubonensis]KVP90012.1 hypothetical protein WJ97_23810 [Burkholderia ubonensis]KVT95586.1 hypothetical protein WK61_15455 [Burkholderia ubonensis]KVU18272.1 hypothetical protein WK64_07735 [Burkholderia ubonensis]KWC56544.1 hypothetical protein WL53_16360 [Burkholderia ubonensis]
MATVEKRPLTEDELADRDRLVEAWRRYKSAHPGASQIWLAEATGLGTQGLISQYFRGVIPLNVKALLAICAQIGADPVEISPRLARDLPSTERGAAQTSVSSAAQALIDAILKADKAGEPAQTFALMLRMLPDPDEPFRLEDPSP